MTKPILPKKSNSWKIIILYIIFVMKAAFSAMLIMICTFQMKHLWKTKFIIPNTMFI